MSQFWENDLCPGCEGAERYIDKLEDRVAALEEQIRELNAELRQVHLELQESKHEQND